MTGPQDCQACDGRGWHHAESGGGEPRYRWVRRTMSSVPVKAKCDDCNGGGQTCGSCGAPWDTDDERCTSCEATTRSAASPCDGCDTPLTGGYPRCCLDCEVNR